MKTPARAEGFRHEAIFYEGPETYAEKTAPFVQEGLAAGEPVLVMAPPDRIAALQRTLGGDAHRVRFEDMTRVGRNPARIIPAWRDFAEAHAGRPARGIGEPIWVGRSPDELDECQLHESLLNLAFEGADGFWLVCPYDAVGLPADVVAGARRRHPFGDGASLHEFAGIPSPAEVFGRPLPAAPPGTHETSFDRDSVRHVRSFAADHAAAFGFDEIRRENFVLAAHELAINSVVHGGGAGRIRIWENGGSLVAEITDRGVFDAPLVGRMRPGFEQEDGRGVWLANQLCDLVQIRSDAAGSVVRIHLSR